MDGRYDLVAVGCGAAGLSAALACIEEAQSRGGAPRIAIIERSPEEHRGGATRWSWVNVMVDPDGVVDAAVLEPLLDSDSAYDRDYFDELCRLAGDSVRWMTANGVRIEHRTPPFAMSSRYGAVEGGGLALVDAFAERVERYPHAEFHYRTEAVRLTQDAAGRVDGVVVRADDGRTRRLSASSVVLACGGFEGDYGELTKYIGPRARQIRPVAPGLRFNTGDGLRMATELGAATAGQFDMLHVELVDPRSARPDPGVFGAPYGIMVDGAGRRFLDEGARTFEGINEPLAWTVWRDHGNLAYFVFDARSAELPGFDFLNQTDQPPYQGDTIGELAVEMGVPAAQLAATVAEFNAAVCPGEFDPSRRDGKRTAGLAIEKSNWAMPLDRGPYRAYPGAAAITFCFGGVRTDHRARVVTPAGTPIPGLYAAGVVTGVWYGEYPGALSVLRAVTFGRIAGRAAARTAAERNGAGGTAGTVDRATAEVGR